MSAPIIRHESPKHPADDPSHPIPSLAVLDVVTILKGGGADLSIIVASPLASDPYSLTRLLDKIEGYLQHILSTEFQAEAGAPSPDKHPSSSFFIRIRRRRSMISWSVQRAGYWPIMHRYALSDSTLSCTKPAPNISVKRTAVPLRGPSAAYLGR